MVRIDFTKKKGGALHDLGLNRNSIKVLPR